MGDSSPGNHEVQQIVERLLKLQEENRRKIRPGEAKSAPSTPTTEQRGVTRHLSRHGTFIGTRGQQVCPPTYIATPTHSHLPYMHPLPAHCPTPQSYQPMDLKSPNFTKNGRHGLKHMSRSTPSMSPSGSPPHSDSEGVTHVSRRTKKFLRRFRNVPSTERVINYYACAIVSDILLQGTLFITDNYFAFYSNIFGYVNKTLIPIANVSDIQKEKTAKFIPNAVGLHTFDGETFVFSSLISRDATYKFMVHMWRKSRKLTDSDIESTMHGVTEETCLDESGSNSADSAVEDCINYSDGDALKSGIATQNAVTWSKSTPLIGPGSYSAETSVSYTENNSSNTTPETCISTTSYHEVRNSIEVIGTSASENETSVDWQDNVSVSGHHHQLTSRSGTELKEGRVKWVVSANVARRVVSIGIAPFRAAKESIEEFTFQPKSFLIFLSSSLILCLLMSAAYMVYRVETLNSQLNSNSVHYGDLYEKVLQMQQKLHAATAHEIEETITTQLQQLLTVKRSLEALNFLLNTDYSQSSSNLQERTH